jgi:Family of unknown function (DUF6454)
MLQLDHPAMTAVRICALLAFWIGLAAPQAVEVRSLGDFTLERTLQLAGETHHVQGIDLDGERIWVTSVDAPRRKGYLLEFSLADGKLLRKVEIGQGERFHPGGLAADGDSLWIPVAEYRRTSSAVIQRRSKRTLEVEFEFPVGDHIGCVAASSAELLGGNWDSRDFYVWNRQGRQLRKMHNPTENHYQDLKFLGAQLVASGLLPDRAGAIDWLEYPSLKLLRRISAGKTDRSVEFTREGMTIRGERLYLLPEDGPSRVFVFRMDRSIP